MEKLTPCKIQLVMLSLLRSYLTALLFHGSQPLATEHQNSDLASKPKSEPQSHREDGSYRPSHDKKRKQGLF